MNATLKAAYIAARKSGQPARYALSIAKESACIAELGLPRYPQDTVITLDGTMFTIKVEHDYDSSPFDWDCHYGIPEENRNSSYSRDREPGQVLIGNYRSSYVYDRADAITECMKQNPQWPRCTRFQHAVEAVDREIEYWTQWLNDDRYFIGLIVTAESSEGFTAESSLWGIEAGDSQGYWRSCAADLIADCQHDITRQRIDRICAMDTADKADFAGIEFA